MRKTDVVITVHPAGAILFGIAFLFLPVPEILAILMGLLLHEGCHFAAMWLAGVRVLQMELTPFGGMMDAQVYNDLPAAKQAMCAGAGIAGSAMGYLLWKEQSGLFVNAFRNVNLSLFVVNALPLWPVDGARVILAFAKKAGSENAVRKILSYLAYAVGVVMVILGIYGVWIGITNLSLLLCGPYLCYAARQGYIAQRVRQLQKSYYGGRNGHTPMLASVYVARQEFEHMAKVITLAKREAGRYQLLFTLDSSNKIIRVETEDEIMEEITGSTCIDK